jgi:hypothetical protein
MWYASERAISGLTSTYWVLAVSVDWTVSTVTLALSVSGDEVDLTVSTFNR